jgi:hypothetical protein
MLTERRLWLGATITAIGILLLMIAQPPPQRRYAPVIYATYGTFGGVHVFRSTDNGATWQSLDASPCGESAKDSAALASLTNPNAQLVWRHDEKVAGDSDRNRIIDGVRR